jgi:hypothetical protein
VTGADDSVEPKRLYEIWKQYPLVEWGILFSAKYEDSARFPSRAWLIDLGILLQRGMAASAHLCGEYMRPMLCEWVMKAMPFSDDFQRVQLNFHGILQHPIWPRLLANVNKLMKPIIVQMDGVNDRIYTFLRAAYPFTYPLFDRSGGAGIVPEQWPAPIGYCGYAGGLGPDNLEAELVRLEQVVGDREIWIDMETHVRSDNNKVFDLDKVARCLDIVRKFTDRQKAGTA